MEVREGLRTIGLQQLLGVRRELAAVQEEVGGQWAGRELVDCVEKSKAHLTCADAAKAERSQRGHGFVGWTWS